MVDRIVCFFWPDIDKKDIQKFSILSAVLFCTIGSYWLLRLLKNTIFLKVAFPESLGWLPEQGGLFQPIAKTWSVFIIIICVLFYSKLVDLVKRHHLFYILCTFYTVIFASISSLLFFRSFSGDAAIGKIPLAAMGWLCYFSIESFGSLMIPLFWSFVISVTDSNTAKIGFPIIIAGAEIGSIGGSALIMFAHRIGGIWQLFSLATLFVICIIALIYYFMKVIPSKELAESPEVKKAEKIEKEKKKEGFLYGFYGGLSLLFTRPYLLGVLVVSTVYEIIATITEYQMLRYASTVYTTEISFARFQGMFGVCVNSLAFLLALLGVSYLMKRFGLRITLLIFPITLGIALICYYMFFTLSNPTVVQLLWATFCIMVLSRGLTYAVNNPSKDMMYIPTSKDAKFKAKGWVDMFGGRTSKMAGARITNAMKHDMVLLMTFGTIFGLGIIALWLCAALFVGKKNKQLIDSGEIVS